MSLDSSIGKGSLNTQDCSPFSQFVGGLRLQLLNRTYLLKRLILNSDSPQIILTWLEGHVLRAHPLGKEKGERSLTEDCIPQDNMAELICN